MRGVDQVLASNQQRLYYVKNDKMGYFPFGLAQIQCIEANELDLMRNDSSVCPKGVALVGLEEYLDLYLENIELKRRLDSVESCLSSAKKIQQSMDYVIARAIDATANKTL